MQQQQQQQQQEIASTEGLQQADGKQQMQEEQQQQEPVQQQAMQLVPLSVQDLVAVLNQLGSIARRQQASSSGGSAVTSPFVEDQALQQTLAVVSVACCQLLLLPTCLFPGLLRKKKALQGFPRLICTLCRCQLTTLGGVYLVWSVCHLHSVLYMM
jgi:hypothetical protein